MANKESSLLKMFLALFLIAVIAAVGLAAVYNVTKDPIEISKNKKKSDAIQSVLPGFKGELKDQELTLEGDKKPVTVHCAYTDGQLMGAAVETYTEKAFSGRFDIMVGLDTNGNILGTAVLTHSETPGLGAKITDKESHFIQQFVGMNPHENPLTVKKDGGEVDAITAATISSRAYCDAIERASRAFNQVKEEEHE